MANEQIDHIRELQQKLYTRDPERVPKRKFGILHPVRQKTESTWGQTELPETEYSHPKAATGYKRFFAFAVIFFVLALAGALFSFYRGAITLSSKNVDLIILGNSFVAGGEELPIQVEIANKNAADLVNAELIINYPKGATDETGSDVVRIERSLGTIPSGKTKSEEFIAVLYGEQGISRDITATLTYELQGSSASFEKKTTFSVMVSSSPVGLVVDAPTGVVSNQTFTLNIRNSFSGDKLLNNVITRVEYPQGFVFQSATPAPVSGNNVWKLGDLQKGDERTIAIQGKLLGEQLDEKAFRIYVGVPESETSNKIAVAYNSVLTTLHIIQPFISGTINVAGKGDDVIPLTIGDEVEGQIKWVNTSPQTINNPTFALHISGNGVIPSSISAQNSFYDALDNTISWTADSNGALASIPPGMQGILPFSFSTDQSVSGVRDITLALSIKGTFPDQGNIEQSIDTIDQKIIRFASTLQFSAQSLYAIGPIRNTGPYPPKANTDTTYTLAWTLLPTDNALTGTSVSAVLPTGVIWTGTTSPTTENLSYNADTRTVTWNAGSLPKATTSPKTRSVAFQVKVRPTKSQVGNYLTLLGDSTVVATDSVTQTKLTASRPALTTKFDTDPAYTEGKDRVLP